MQWRYNLTHFLLASVVVLGLTPLMLCVEAQAQIAFMSDRDGNREIYVMAADGVIREDSLTITLLNGIFHGHRTVNSLPLLLVGIRTLRVGSGKSTWWTPMGIIREDSLTITLLNGILHGHRTVNSLPLLLVGIRALRVGGKST